MNLFKELENEKRAENPQTESAAEESANAVDETQSEAVDERRELSVAAYDILMLRARRAKRAAIAFWCVLIGIIVVIVGFLIIMRSIKGEGFISNMFARTHVRIELPIAQHTPVDESETDEYGRYTITGLYKAVSDAVVSLETYSSANAFVPYSKGSGFLISSDGYIVTNAHVIDAADFGIKVITNDGKEYAAIVVGSDSRSDIAVIKIDVADMEYVSLGASEALEIGETVCAIGNPAGYSGSMTTGVVSGLNREIRTSSDNLEMKCIQIDAAINPGNSGGALFNLWGEVVGITSSKLNASSYEGIGFAINSEEAKPIIESLIEYGYVADRPRVGITFSSISAAMAEAYGTVPGLYVYEISPDCDVSNTDLQTGDIITEMNGIKVQGTDDIDEVLKDLLPGDTITAKVYRFSLTGEETTFEITFKLESWDETRE